jgi:hypothetical protein
VQVFIWLLYAFLFSVVGFIKEFLHLGDAAHETFFGSNVNYDLFIVKIESDCVEVAYNSTRLSPAEKIYYSLEYAPLTLFELEWHSHRYVIYLAYFYHFLLSLTMLMASNSFRKCFHKDDQSISCGNFNVEKLNCFRFIAID